MPALALEKCVRPSPHARVKYLLQSTEGRRVVEHPAAQKPAVHRAVDDDPRE